MGFPRRAQWSGLPFPSSGGFPDPGIEAASPALAERFFTSEPSENAMAMSGSVPHLRTSAYLCLGSRVTSPPAPCGWALRYVGGPLGLIASFSFTLDCCLSELFVWQKYFEHNMSLTTLVVWAVEWWSLKRTLGFVLFFPLSSFSWSRRSLCGKLWVQCLAHSSLCCSAMFSRASIYLDKYSPAPTLSPLTTMCSEWWSSCQISNMPPLFRLQSLLCHMH